MSGLEVVGVVLGALPLIIAAVDKYKATSQRIKFFRFKEPCIAELIEALKEQHFFIRADLQTTLKATRLDDDEIADLVAKPGSNLFDDPNISLDVQEYLGDGYDAYTAGVGRCQRILTDIAHHLRGLTSTQGQDLAQIVDAQPITDGRYEITRRIKFSLAKHELEQRIRELKDATQTLRRVRKSSTPQADVTLQESSRATARYTRRLESVRNHAHQLYQAISTGYVGGCHREHDTFLFLQSRSEVMDRNGRMSSGQAQINFDVAFPPAAPTSIMPVTCYITKVKVKRDDTPSAPTLPSLTGSSPTVVQLLVAPTPQPAHPQDTKIDDLCRSVTKSWSDGTLLALYLSQAGSLTCKHLPLNIAQKRDLNSSDILSLHQILQATAQMQIYPRLFTIVQRVSLSFNVAASLLQLYSIQWLTPSFTSESIYVTAESCASTHVPSQNFSIPLKPFIMHKFQETTRPGTNEPNARRSLLELGIVLLELWLFRSLESYATEVNMPTGDSFGIRFDLAQSWLNSSAPLMLPFYLDVVTRCVECTFATSTGVPRWDDIVFRRSVCKYVLRPLWKSCQPDFR